MKKKVKGIVSLLIIMALVFNHNILVYASNPEQVNTETSEEMLMDAYEELVEYTETYKIPFSMDSHTFIQEYYSLGYSDIEEYVTIYYRLLVNPNTTRSSLTTASSKWYYNTGTSLPQVANYSKYNLLNTVQAGDIIHESKGGFGITGHTAIVEGKYYDAVQKQYYIRVIEAIDKGVVRSILDDERVVDKGVSIYRVPSATAAQRTKALNFSIGQLGKSYSLDFAKDTSSSELNWYCSELVWAGYYNQGINIETTNLINEPGITPRDITNSTKVSIIPFK